MCAAADRDVEGLGEAVHWKEHTSISRVDHSLRDPHPLAADDDGEARWEDGSERGGVGIEGEGILREIRHP